MDSNVTIVDERSSSNSRNNSNRENQSNTSSGLAPCPENVTDCPEKLSQCSATCNQKCNTEALSQQTACNNLCIKQCMASFGIVSNLSKIHILYLYL